MQTLLEKAKDTIAPTDLRIMIDDITNIAHILMNPGQIPLSFIFLVISLH